MAHVLFSFDTGGLEKGLSTVIGTASADIEHVIVCLTRSGTASRWLPPGTRIVELHKRPGHSLAFIRRLARALREIRPQVVHTRNWSGIDGILAARLAGMRGVVHGEHGWGTEDLVGDLRRRVWIRRFSSRWVREYTCVSKQMVGWLRDVIRIRKPVTQIYNGIDTEHYRPGRDGTRMRERLKIEQDAFVIGVVSRLDPIKDHPTLFRAFEGVRREHPRSRLLVVGDGPQGEPLRSTAGPGIDFLGEREDVPRLLRTMDVFALPSLNEGISNTILEAMATELPVVATDVGGNGELVDHDVTGMLVPPARPEAMEAALVRYGRDPDLRGRHGRAARRKATRVFGIAAMTEAYESVWRRAAAGVRSPRTGDDAPGEASGRTTGPDAPPGGVSFPR